MDHYLNRDVSSELGGFIKKAEILTYILSIVKVDMPVTGSQIVAEARRLNWEISLTFAYKVLKSLEITDPQSDKAPVLYSKWLDEGCRKKGYSCTQSYGDTFLEYARKHLIERIHTTKQFLLDLQSLLKTCGTLLDYSQSENGPYLLSVQEMNRFFILYFSLKGEKPHEFYQKSPLGFEFNKRYFYESIQWLVNYRYMESSPYRVTEDGKRYFNDLCCSISEQLPLAHERLQQLLNYPRYYEKNRCLVHKESKKG